MVSLEQVNDAHRTEVVDDHDQDETGADTPDGPPEGHALALEQVGGEVEGKLVPCDGNHEGGDADGDHRVGGDGHDAVQGVLAGLEGQEEAVVGRDVGRDQVEGGALPDADGADVLHVPEELGIVHDVSPEFLGWCRIYDG